LHDILSTVTQREDEFMGSKILITAQKLPDTFRGDPRNLTTVAAGLKADIPIETQEWGTAYMLNAPDAQVLIFANRASMVIVRSEVGHSTEQWKGFLSSFKVK
jgi:hypothetical protein